MVSQPREAVAAQAWLFRTRAEHDAHLRFARLAGEIATFDAGSPVVPRLAEAAADERRHFFLCAELAESLGAHLPEAWPNALLPVAPERLPRRQAVLYEVVAACCITETESMATLTTLLPHAAGAVERALRQISRDEVRHARVGWAHLAREHQRLDVGFLAELLPRMLEGTVDPGFFSPPVDAALDDDGLLPLGVLPHSLRRDLWVHALEEVVLPGFVLVGVDDAPARAWLLRRRQRANLTVVS